LSFACELLLRPDAMGFPIVEVQSLRLAASLWPMTKVQFEGLVIACPKQRHFSWSGGEIDAWYEDVLSISPRQSWQSGDWHTPTDLSGSVWLTALKTSEAEAIAPLLGEGFHLPSAHEWRAFNRRLSEIPAIGTQFQKMEQNQMWHPAAIYGFRHLRTQTNPTSWADVALFNFGMADIAIEQDGLFQNNHYVGLGQVKGTLWSQMSGVPVPELRRDPRFGLRPFRTTD